MNIYTATKWERREEMSLINNSIRQRGHHITHDWTSWELNNPTKDPADARHAAAMLDYAGVMQADLVIFWDHPEANGARWEAGMAIGSGKPVWLVDYRNVVIFDVLPQVINVGTWNQALSLLESSLAVA